MKTLISIVLTILFAFSNGYKNAPWGSDKKTVSNAMLTECGMIVSTEETLLGFTTFVDEIAVIGTAFTPKTEKLWKYIYIITPEEENRSDTLYFIKDILDEKYNNTEDLEFIILNHSLVERLMHSSSQVELASMGALYLHKKYTRLDATIYLTMIKENDMVKISLSYESKKYTPMKERETEEIENAKKMKIMKDL